MWKMRKCALKAHNQVRYDPERSTTCGGSQTGDQLCCRELAANLKYYDYFYHSTFWFVIVYSWQRRQTVRKYVQTEVREYGPHLLPSLRYLNRSVSRIEYLKESLSSPLCSINQTFANSERKNVLPSLQYQHQNLTKVSLRKDDQKIVELICCCITVK